MLIEGPTATAKPEGPARRQAPSGLVESTARKTRELSR